MSTNSAWDEIENMKGNVAATSADIVDMKNEIQT